MKNIETQKARRTAAFSITEQSDKVSVKLTKRTKIERSTFPNDKIKRATVELPETIADAMAMYCVKNKIKRVDFMCEVIAKELQRHGMFDE